MGIQTIAVLTGGGDAPGMNAAVRAVTRAALHNGLRVLGIRRAYEGMTQGEFCELGPRDVGGIIQRGGTFLKTARFPQFAEPEVQRRALVQLKTHGAGALVAIGGDGTMRGALALHRLGFPVVGIPASIDNDVYGTDIAIGVDTALNTIIEAIDKLRDTASSHQRAFLVETMGRHCGHLALMSGIISGAEMTLVPERDVEPEEVAAAVREAYARGKTHAIVVVSEGAKYPAMKLKQRLDELKLDVDLRVTILGHVQRGGHPSAWDRLIAARFGVAAVERLLAGESGVMVGLRAREVVPVPLEESGSRQREPDMEFYRMGRMLAQ
ncbi:MAG TPA: 6-phosphofructokinase [Burkholderiales bacterium]|jgi:6-phosphofructokinase 1|nr:6-phosphofructokinase [Burkholderiales bacterium]